MAGMTKSYLTRKAYPARRGDVMRRIAALHAKLDLANRPGNGSPTQQGAAKREKEREELNRQIAALTQKMMAP